MATVFDQLLQDPSFLTGVSLLGGRTNQIGQNILGAQQAIAQQNAARQLAAQRQQAMDDAATRRVFNPANYVQDGRVNQGALLSGALASGFDPSEAAQMGTLLQRPASKFSNVAPGGSIFDETTGQVVYQAPFKPEAVPNALQEIAGLQAIINLLPEGPQRQAYEARLAQTTGAAAQEDRKSNLALREATVKQAEAVSEQNRMQRADQARASRIQKFAGQLESAGVPQLERQLQSIEAMLAKYPKDDIPGFSKGQNTLVKSGLGWTLPNEAQQNRQTLQSLANVQLKDRSGAAVTNPEWERFQMELGTGAFMGPERIRHGIKIFRDLVNSTKANLSAGLSDEDIGEYNERNPGIKIPMRGNKAPIGDRAEAAKAELRRRGLIQ